MSSPESSTSSESSFLQHLSDTDDYESTIANAQRLIDSIDNMDLDMDFIPPYTTSSMRRLSQSPERPSGNNTSANRTQRTPSTREIDMDLERISRFCESIDQNLQPQTRGRASQLDTASGAADAATSTAPEPEVIDLSEVPITPISSFHNYILDADGDEDDVVMVSSNLADVVDLCSPLQTNQRANVNQISVRRDVPLNDLSRPFRQISQRERGANILSRRRSTQTSTSNIRSPRNVTACFSNVSVSTVNIAESGDFVAADVSANVSTAKSSNSQSQAGLTCPVCMDSVLNRQPTSTKCGHVFCETCIREAIRITHKCPMCNKKLNARMTFRLYL